MSESGDSTEFDPQKMVEEREASDITNTVIKKAFSRIGIYYILSFLIGFFIIAIMGDIVAGILFPLPELPVSAGEQGFETANEIDRRYRNHDRVQMAFSILGLFAGPLLLYLHRRDHTEEE